MQSLVLLLCALLACVVAAPEGRLSGGDDVEPGQLPYQAALTFGGESLCGAVILSERYVLTAMRCVCSSGSARPWPPQLFSVLVGSVKLYSGGKRIVVEEITINPNYSDFDTGIALLKLSQSLIFTDSTQPIALSDENPPVGAEVEVSGWGRLKESDTNMQPTLQINEAQVVAPEQCLRELGRADSQVLCLEHPRKSGICRGDFGGPAVYRGKLVGIAAAVLGECGSILPDVFTSIASNYDWLVEHMTP